MNAQEKMRRLQFIREYADLCRKHGFFVYCAGSDGFEYYCLNEVGPTGPEDHRRVGTLTWQIHQILEEEGLLPR